MTNYTSFSFFAWMSLLGFMVAMAASLLQGDRTTLAVSGIGILLGVALVTYSKTRVGRSIEPS